MFHKPVYFIGLGKEGGEVLASVRGAMQRHSVEIVDDCFTRNPQFLYIDDDYSRLREAVGSRRAFDQEADMWSVNGVPLHLSKAEALLLTGGVPCQSRGDRSAQLSCISRCLAEYAETDEDDKDGEAVFIRSCEQAGEETLKKGMRCLMESVKPELNLGISFHIFAPLHDVSGTFKLIEFVKYIRELYAQEMEKSLGCAPPAIYLYIDDSLHAAQWAGMRGGSWKESRQQRYADLFALSAAPSMPAAGERQSDAGAQPEWADGCVKLIYLNAPFVSRALTEVQQRENMARICLDSIAMSGNSQNDTVRRLVQGGGSAPEEDAGIIRSARVFCLRYPRLQILELLKSAYASAVYDRWLNGTLHHRGMVDTSYEANKQLFQAFLENEKLGHILENWGDDDEPSPELQASYNRAKLKELLINLEELCSWSVGRDSWGLYQILELLYSLRDFLGGNRIADLTPHDRIQAILFNPELTLTPGLRVKLKDRIGKCIRKLAATISKLETLRRSALKKEADLLESLEQSHDELIYNVYNREKLLVLLNCIRNQADAVFSTALEQIERRYIQPMGGFAFNYKRLDRLVERLEDEGSSLSFWQLSREVVRAEGVPELPSSIYSALETVDVVRIRESLAKQLELAQTKSPWKVSWLPDIDRFNVICYGLPIVSGYSLSETYNALLGWGLAPCHKRWRSALPGFQQKWHYRHGDRDEIRIFTTRLLHRRDLLF